MGVSATPTPTATPVPSVNVAGRWRGTFSGRSVLCSYTSSVRVDAHAELSQNGSALEGAVSAGCAFHASYNGTLVGQSLALRGSDNTSIRGTASATHIEADAAAPYGLMSGRLSLDRVSP
jgi:hypothetical protein